MFLLRVEPLRRPGGLKRRAERIIEFSAGRCESIADSVVDVCVVHCSPSFASASAPPSSCALQRAEVHRREALEERDRKLAAEQKKAEAKAQKKKTATSASAAPASPLLPSVSSIAHMPEPRVGGIVHGDGDNDADSQQQQQHQLESDLASMAVSSSSSTSARVVLNHSTHIDGLLPFIAKLEKTHYVKTILPGALSGGHANAQTFDVAFQSESNDGAFNFVAKSGSMRQDLRITPKLKIVKLQMIVDAIDGILNPPQTATSEAASSSSAPIAVNSNKLVAALAADAHRKSGQAQHLELREKEKAAKHAREVHEKEKKLKAKIGQKNEAVGSLAEKWVDWEKKK